MFFILASRKILDTADIAFLLVSDVTDGACGVANFHTTDLPFGVVDHNCGRGILGFGHEIGHIIGAHHNIEIVTPPYPNNYGFGLLVEPRSKQRRGGLHTIMA